MSIKNLKKLLESEREDLQNLFAQFDSDRKVEFIEKYPMLWSDVFDIMEESRYHRAMINSVLAGHNSATNRLLPLLQKAVEMATFYADKENYESRDKSLTTGNKVYDIILFDFDRNLEKKKDYAGKKAREFLAELTKMTKIKKEGE